MDRVISKKVALCFAGLPRLTHQTEKTWKNFICKYNADVYVHTWIIDENYRNTITKNIIESIHPKQFILEPVKQFDISKYNERIWPYRSHPFNVLSMWYSIKEVIDLCSQSYDIICRARFDWLCPNLELIDSIGLTVPDDPGLNNHHFTYNNQQYIGHNDQFGYGTPEIMKIYANTFNRIPQLYNNGVDFCSELFLGLA